jgi:hypothetical protein
VLRTKWRAISATPALDLLPAAAGVVRDELVELSSAKNIYLVLGT